MEYDNYSDETRSAYISYAKAWFISAGIGVVGAIIAFSQKPMFANPEDIPLLILVGALFLASFSMAGVATVRNVRFIRSESADRKKMKKENIKRPRT